MDDHEELLQNVPSMFVEIANVIGVESALLLTKSFGGQYIYVPKADTIDKYYRNKRIRDEFTGYNARELSIKYNLSEVQIRTIVSDIVKKKKSEPMDGQTSLFDLKTE